jgi:hypothetical protein
VDEQMFERELGRLRREELPALEEELARSAVHAEIDALLRTHELIARELGRTDGAVKLSDKRDKHVEVVVRLLEIAREHPQHSREHEGLVALAKHLGGPAWAEALEG